MNGTGSNVVRGATPRACASDVARERASVPPLRRWLSRLALLLALATGFLTAAGMAWTEGETETETETETQDLLAEGGEDGETESTDDEARSTRQEHPTETPPTCGLTPARSPRALTPSTRAPPRARWSLPRRVPPDDDEDDDLRA